MGCNCKTVMYFQTLGNVSKTVTRAAASSGRREGGRSDLHGKREGGREGNRSGKRGMEETGAEGIFPWTAQASRSPDRPTE